MWSLVVTEKCFFKQFLKGFLRDTLISVTLKTQLHRKWLHGNPHPPKTFYFRKDWIRMTYWKRMKHRAFLDIATLFDFYIAPYIDSLYRFFMVQTLNFSQYLAGFLCQSSESQGFPRETQALKTPYYSATNQILFYKCNSG